MIDDAAMVIVMSALLATLHDGYDAHAYYAIAFAAFSLFTMPIRLLLDIDIYAATILPRARSAA